jgi:plastocyanin
MRITSDYKGRQTCDEGSLNVQRFRLLSYYVAGIAVVVGLAVWGVSMRRAAADAGTPQASASEGGGSSTGSPEQSTVIMIDNFLFNPKEFIVPSGTTVAWVNADEFPHTATSTATPPVFDSKVLDKDDKFSFRFQTPGTYDYFCKLHPTMTGRIVVK